MTRAPPMTSECPPRYFVVECMTTSAPSASGCCRYGEAKVLSTTSVALLAWATSASARDVGDVEQGIGGRLDPEDLGGRGDRRGHGVDVVDRHKRVGDAPLGQHLVQQPEGSAVDVVGQDNVIAGAYEGAQGGVSGRHPGGETTVRRCHLRATPERSRRRNGSGCRRGRSRTRRGSGRRRPARTSSRCGSAG